MYNRINKSLVYRRIITYDGITVYNTFILDGYTDTPPPTHTHAQTYNA